MITKKCLFSFSAFAATLLLCLVSVSIMSCFAVSEWVGVSAGGGAFIVMLVAAIIYRRRKVVRYVAVCVNAMASGVAMSSLFVHLGNFPYFTHTALLFATLCALFYLYCLFARIRFFAEHYVICMTAYLALVATGVIAGAVLAEAAVFKLAGLCLVPFIAFFVTIAVCAKNREAHLKSLEYASFAALVIAIAVVIVLLSEGDGIDGFSPDGVSLPNGKKRNPYEFARGSGLSEITTGVFKKSKRR